MSWVMVQFESMLGKNRYAAIAASYKSSKLHSRFVTLAIMAAVGRSRPACHISKQADAMTVYFEGDADYSKRLSDHVTLYLSLETEEIVGCRIKGISGILSDLPNYISVDHNGVNLSIIFLAFRGGADEVVSKAVNELARVATEREMVLETSA